MLTVSLALIVLGAALLYAGWTGKSLPALFAGSNQVQAKTPQGATRKPLGQGVTS